MKKMEPLPVEEQPRMLTFLNVMLLPLIARTIVHSQIEVHLDKESWEVLKKIIKFCWGPVGYFSLKKQSKTKQNRISYLSPSPQYTDRHCDCRWGAFPQGPVFCCWKPHFIGFPLECSLFCSLCCPVHWNLSLWRILGSLCAGFSALMRPVHWARVLMEPQSPCHSKPSKQLLPCVLSVSQSLLTPFVHDHSPWLVSLRLESRQWEKCNPTHLPFLVSWLPAQLLPVPSYFLNGIEMSVSLVEVAR